MVMNGHYCHFEHLFCQEKRKANIHKQIKRKGNIILFYLYTLLHFIIFNFACKYHKKI